jgi:hypothetical protein
MHVGDDPDHVARNRTSMSKALALPAQPLWLRQVHGTRVVVHDGSLVEPEADAAVTFKSGHVLAILTADCLPVVLASRDGSCVGVAHAGWRGLADGVIENTLRSLGVPGSELVAWLGPAIGPAAFEVGPEVRARFVDVDAGASVAFSENARGRWQADLCALARRRLMLAGVSEIATADACTFSSVDLFYSFRRQSVTGRMATLAWLQA